MRITEIVEHQKIPDNVVQGQYWLDRDGEVFYSGRFILMTCECVEVQVECDSEEQFNEIKAKYPFVVEEPYGCGFVFGANTLKDSTYRKV